MAQIEEDDLKNYNLKRFDCEDPFFMEIFALKVDNAGYYYYYLLLFIDISDIKYIP